MYETKMGSPWPFAATATAGANSRTIVGPAGLPIEYALHNCEPMRPRGHIVFIMGLGNHRTVWELQRQHFEGTHAMLFIDNRGIGLSGSPRGLYTLESLAADALYVLEHAAHHWPSTGIHLVGHSMGALVAYEMLLAAPPGRFASLAMLSASLPPPNSCWGSIFHMRYSGLCQLAAMCAVPAMMNPPNSSQPYGSHAERTGWRLHAWCRLICPAGGSLIKASLELNYTPEWLTSPAFDGQGGRIKHASCICMEHWHAYAYLLETAKAVGSSIDCERPSSHREHGLWRHHGRGWRAATVSLLLRRGGLVGAAEYACTRNDNSMHTFTGEHACACLF